MAMNKEQREQVEAVEKKAWEAIELLLGDVLRIANGGFNNSERDRDLLRLVFSAAAGRVYTIKSSREG